MNETPVAHLVARLEKLRATPRQRRPQWTCADTAALAHVLGNYDGPAGDPKLLKRATRPPRTPEQYERDRLRIAVARLERRAAAEREQER